MLGMIGRKICISPLQDPDKSKGGIWIPDVAKERADQGIVKYVSEKCKLGLKPGDWVMFSAYSGDVIILEDEGSVIIVDERSIVCKVEAVGEININSLYYKGKDGQYHPTTYEAAIELLTWTLGQTEEARSIKGVEKMKKHHGGDTPFDEDDES